MNNLTKEYENQVTKIEDRVGAKDNPLTIKDLQDELCLRYERMNDHAIETDESEDDEKAMVAMTKFKGKCHRCGVYGHKGADCRSSGADGSGNGGNGDSGGGGKGRIICHYCKKPGHKVSECRKKKRDQQQGGNNGNGGGSSTEVAAPLVSVTITPLLPIESPFFSA